MKTPEEKYTNDPMYKRLKTPEEKYTNDPMYKRLVDAMESMIHQAEFAPSELR